MQCGILDWILEWRTDISEKKERSRPGEKLMAHKLGPTIIGTCLQRKGRKQQVGVLTAAQTIVKRPQGWAAILVRVQHHMRSLWPLWFFLA